jgi:uncharacterized membrane protein
VDDFDLYRLFKTLHVIAVVLLGGAIVVESLSGPLVARARTVQEIRVYARLMYISENYISIPAAIAIAIFGYATADRAGIDLDITWLALSQILFYAVVVLALVVLRPASTKLQRMAQAAPDGPVTPELSAQLKEPLPAIIGSLASMIFMFIVYLMVSKPAW